MSEAIYEAWRGFAGFDPSLGSFTSWFKFRWLHALRAERKRVKDVSLSGGSEARWRPVPLPTQHLRMPATMGVPRQRVAMAVGVKKGPYVKVSPERKAASYVARGLARKSRMTDEEWREFCRAASRARWTKKA